ncbi:2-oxoisovalerate dehydrogenase E2 component (dihydrolipoyl transacylase) [Paenibacillus shirakamiensis]|uniref:Dihydrolipoamide acetyltransferase component of pyruvate dehydrogenase complex n=1 Tax=Paenibacillus shirakamiensis TaxID=1265935 RepID=A0ABS4JFV7_9BACL|nr:dihydrolipoamide acetyltransferase family protein [Paenibacillus shirakamiensis]MBP1999469.1 2-oxoisovalerate dehydrogenase E2 component (dihydrolipoyl transacylase) [Paenibacillus shirakamiensis]
MSSNKLWTDVAMPQLAESLVSATIGKWLKKPGDPVEQYEPICEVITDKVNAELPSTVDGIMGEIFAAEGDTIDVGTIICQIGIEGQEPVQAEEQGQPQVQQSLDFTGQDVSQRNRYSPAVQTLAAEHGLNLSQIKGSGLGGRITRKDVLNYVESGVGTGSGNLANIPASTPVQAQVPSNSQQESVVSTQQSSIPVAAISPEKRANEPVRHTGMHLSDTPKLPTIEVEGGQAEQYIDITPIRNTIATRMRQSVSEIPHGWMMIEVDVTNLVQLRNKLKNEFKAKEGVNLTYLAFLMKAVVSAIKDYPIMNSVWAVDKIIVKRDINISLAVGTDDSVMTPVIKKADQKNIAGLAREVEELARKTREGKLKLDDMQGGTFTVNNTGSFGSILSQPIINYPQAAILTFESIVKRPVVINDMIGVRSMANICLSLDHRILDGVICGRFMQRVKDNIEGYTLDTQVY